MSYEVKAEDVEYTRHGGIPQLARLYRPQGRGPFPIMVELHGGAWCRSDRLADRPGLRRIAAEWIIGPVFVSGIASRTLAGIAAVAERRAGA